MTYKIPYQLPRFMPYLIIGLLIAFFLYLLPIISRIIIFGLMIGAGLWLFKFIQGYFFSSTHSESHHSPSTNHQRSNRSEPSDYSKTKKKGRIIDYKE